MFPVGLYFSLVNTESFRPRHTSGYVITGDDMSSSFPWVFRWWLFWSQSFSLYPGFTDHMFSHTCVSMRLGGAITVSERYGLQYNCFFTTPQSLTHSHFAQTIQTEVCNWMMSCKIYTTQCISVTAFRGHICFPCAYNCRWFSH